jgi:hypothetical protein
LVHFRDREGATRSQINNYECRFSYRTFEKFRAESQALSDVFAFDEMHTLNVVADNRAEWLPGNS